ncbi:MAG: cupredoxin domain-containing protein [Armatimonadetes bacterium]|nr:cupredoxin domain-containing protein [Armatimonadota bacterium]
MKSKKNTLIALAGISLLAIGLPAWTASAPTPEQGCCAGMTAQHEGHQHSDPDHRSVEAKVKNGVQFASVVADGGYQPGTVTAKAGMRLELTFTLGKRPGCASTVSFPGLKIKKSIPAGKGVVIKFTPAKAGEVPFECGMGMYKGKIIVK